MAETNLCSRIRRPGIPLEGSNGITLDSLTRQLAAARERLMDLAPSDFTGRYRVEREQDRLRNIAREFAVDPDSFRSTDDLLAELTTRKEALDVIRREAIYLGEGATVNIEMRAARGTARLVQRIAHLEEIVCKRGTVESRQIP